MKEKTLGLTKPTPPPLVPPPIAALLSALVPGLGQMLSHQIQRGILLLGSQITTLAILYFQMADLGRRAGEGWPALLRALSRRPVFVILSLLVVLTVWVVGAVDAYLAAKERKKPKTGVFAVVLLGFFTLGWQISEIDLLRLVQRFPEALPPLSRVIWPWEAAFEQETQELTGSATILAVEDDSVIPSASLIPDGAPLELEEGENEPLGARIWADPNWGEMSSQDVNFQPVAGTKITVTGAGFSPNTETVIWWEDPIGNEFRPREEGDYLLITTDDVGSFVFEMTMPYSLTPPSAVGPFYHTLEARQITGVGDFRPSVALSSTVERMIETIFMGMMATIFGIVFSIPVSFLAARNIMQGTKVTMGIYYLVRTILNIIRSIEPLIWALIAVVWVGLGPFAGIVALTVHSIAALGKLYSEAIEGIDPGPIEAVQATGASRLQTILFGVIPQMISPFISFSIYRWDINVRMSTVIGLVGGGGIGFLLVQYIRLADYRSAGIAVWFIAITVGILDYVSADIRNKMI